MRRAFLIALGVLVLLGLYGWAEAVQDPRVVRYAVGLDGLDRRLRIVQLSDSHGSWIDMPPVRLARIVDRVNALHPDMIVLTGDYIGGKIVDRPRIRLEKVLLPFDRLRAPLGVYAVAGNHDTVFWTRWVFAKTRVRLLVNEWADAGPVVVAGMNDYSNSTGHADDLMRLGARLPPGRPAVLLMHEPDFFQLLPRNIGLMIAGHTHGGQIVLPLWGPLYMGDYHRLHRRGLFTDNGNPRQAMVVSSGLGTSVVPIRIGVPPEIVVIDVLPPPPGGRWRYSTGRKSGTDR